MTHSIMVNLIEISS